MKSARLLVLALFLMQRLVAVGELFHDHEGETESDVATICHTCDDRCPSEDDTHHHHPSGSDEHSDGLCPSCVQMFVHLPPATLSVELPEPRTHFERVIPPPTPAEVHASIHGCRAPPVL